jgi:hypothetical protein
MLLKLKSIDSLILLYIEVNLVSLDFFVILCSISHTNTFLIQINDLV